MKKFHFNIGIITFLFVFAFALTAKEYSLSKIEKKKVSTPPLHQKLDRDINKYKLLVDEMLASRATAVNLVKKLKEKLKKIPLFPERIWTYLIKECCISSSFEKRYLILRENTNIPKK